MAVLQTTLSLTISGTDVTSDLMPDLLSFTYTDNEKDESDEVSVTLKDETGRWAGSWKPEGGEKVTASIMKGIAPGIPTGMLPCGTFHVDSLRVSGAPRVFEMRACAIPLNTTIRRRVKTRAWEKTDLKAIAGKIATEAGLTLFWDSEDDVPTYDRADQDRESDLKFLGKLCEEAGISVKVTADKLVLFDQASYERKPAVKTITLGVSDVISWDFSSEQSEKYKSVTVSYRDPKIKKKGTAASYYNADFEKVTVKASKNPAVNSFTYTDPNADENGQEYALKKRAKSVAEAERLAKAKLRQLNARAVTGSLNLVGDTDLVAGVVIAVSGFGSFDGNFIIERATHSVSSSGYTTSLSLRRVNANY